MPSKSAAYPKTENLRSLPENRIRTSNPKKAPSNETIRRSATLGGATQKKRTARISRSGRCGMPHDSKYEDLTPRNKDLEPILDLIAVPFDSNLLALNEKDKPTLAENAIRRLPAL